MVRIWWQQLLFTAILVPHALLAAKRDGLPKAELVQRTIRDHFQETERRPTDLISRADVESLLGKLSELGWEVEDGEEILSKTLSESHPLVAIMRSPRGKKFMRKVSGDKLIYDRLERIVKQRGGQRLLRDLVKLPDGERYAKQRTPHGVPSLVELLPKTRNGKIQRVAKYSQPTGNLYTPKAINARIEQSYERASKIVANPTVTQ